MTLVVDASVALRWYVDAPGSDAAAEVLTSDEVLVAPDLVVSEVANAAWKLARAGEISRTHGQSVAAAIPHAFTQLEPTTRLIAAAYRLATDLDHPIYDCLYLALADREQCQLLTADRRLLRTLEATSRQELCRPLFGDAPDEQP